MSACGVTVVVTIAFAALPLLLLETGSPVSDVLATVLVNVPLAGAVTVTVKFVVAVFVNEVIDHVTTPFVTAPPPLALTNVTVDGNVSLTTMFDPVDGPMFVTVIV